ncbi:MAG: glycosyltransferase family 39 protein [Acidobacteria bacterium]|nr:glycosyltransferase family 39 protein [Acidobacteriota bacterium]
MFGKFFLPILVFVLVLQFLSGAYQSELSHWPDEAAHVTTTLMVRDYLVSGFASPPFQFAQEYYVRYPKVGLGMWPPVFYVVATVWVLLFGEPRVSLLVLMELVCALLAVTLALFARRGFGDLPALGLGLLLVALPVMQDGTSMVMLDLPVALLGFWALLLLLRFFRTEQTRWALLFGLATALALLTKANAIALVLAPAILVVLAGRYRLFLRPDLYLSALVVACLGLPWQIFSYRMLSSSVPMEPLSASYVARALVLYGAGIYRNLGAGLFVAAGLGFTVECARLLSRRKDSCLDLAAAAALVVAVVSFHSLVTTSVDLRYMMMAWPFFLLFAAAGIRWMAGLISLRLPLSIPKHLVAGGLCVLALVFTPMRIPKRPELGFARVAEMVSSSAGDEVVFVCSDANGEGALITELALRSARRKHVVLRASKTISDNLWTPAAYTPLLRTAEEVSRFLEEIPVDAVVIDNSAVIWEQDRAVLVEALQHGGARWTLVPEAAGSPVSRRISLYRRTEPALSRAEYIRVPVRHTLGGELVLRR